MTAFPRLDSAEPDQGDKLAILRFDKSDLALFLAVVLILDLFCVALLSVMDIRDAADEDGPIESIQLSMLGFAFAMLLMTAFRTTGVVSAVAVAAAAIAIASFSREFDPPIEHPALEFVRSNLFRALALILLLGWAGIRFFRDPADVPALFLWVRRVGWWPFLISLALLVIGYSLEKQQKNYGIHWEFLEEVMELNGYAVFLFAAVLMWQKAMRAGSS